MATMSIARRAVGTLTCGSDLRKSVFLLALPAVGEQLLNTAVGLTDNYLVGHLAPDVAEAMGYGRATALASVGLGNMVAWITTILFMSVAVGSTAVIARRVGEGDHAGAERTLQQSLLLVFFTGALATAIGVFLGEPILRLLGATPEVAAIGGSYLRIIAYSFIPAAMMFAGTASLRGAGDMRSPLYLMALVNVVNIAISWLLVNGMLGFPALGVDGSAIGTAISRVVGGVVLLALLAAGRMRLRWRFDWRPQWDVLRRVLKVGLPFAADQLVFNTAAVLVVRLITGLGTASYAAHTLTINIESISFLPGLGFAAAATTLVGQALGAKDEERARRSAFEALFQGGLIMTVLGAVMIAIPGTLLHIMTSEPTVIREAITPLRIAGLGQPLLAVFFILNGALRGAGDTKFTMYVRFITTWGLRGLLSFFFVGFLGMGLEGIWIAMAFDWIGHALLSLWRWNSGYWRTIQV
ncbi:MAG TPA: MATE family efflux transporter [Ardenticatenaceae bacterium]